MNKLEEYRDKTILNLQNRYPEADFAWSDGFDAAIALDLPVKFAKWKDENTKLITVNKDPKILYMFLPYKDRDIPLLGIEKLYKYWIENIYKPE